MNRSAAGLLASFAVLASLQPGASHAIDFERMVMPGPVIQGHADVEGSCRRCHSPFERESEKGLCLGCHEAIAGDIDGRVGFHGRQSTISTSPCRDCHGEHKGRAADVVGLNVDAFDHSLTDSTLKGAHARVPCGSCHSADQKYREASVSCSECHERDDRHRGRLGSDCARCHSESDWKRARFDHDTTDFRLAGEHRQIDCSVCHPGEAYKDTPSRCRDCHAADDVHRGSFGASCVGCHEPAGWKRATFDHDEKTDFPLRGSHRTATCTACHGALGPGIHPGKVDPRQPPGSKRRTDARCIACHQADDFHRGNFGEDCAGCHAADSWKKSRFDHLRDARFELKGSHRDQSCSSCHRGDVEKEKVSGECSSCHLSDDVHRGQEGDRCESCHDETSWTGGVKFDHELTRFPLLGLHSLAPCEECHTSLEFQEAATTCNECHAMRDVHERGLGTSCELCHNPNAWGLWQFDHDSQTSFALGRGHGKLSCESCHQSAMGERISLSKRCESCHAMNDPHRGSFGPRCGSCHVDASWDELRMGR